MGVLRLLDMVLRIVIAAILMFSTNWQLALIAWALIPLVAFQSVRIQLESRRAWNRVQDQLGRVTNVLQENLTGTRVVKAFSREESENEKFDKEADELYHWSIQAEPHSGPEQPVLPGDVDAVAGLRAWVSALT